MVNALEACLKDTPYHLEIINIDADPVLQSQYAGRIPVLMHEGNLLSEYFLDKQKIAEISKLPDQAVE